MLLDKENESAQVRWQDFPQKLKGRQTMWPAPHAKPGLIRKNFYIPCSISYHACAKETFTNELCYSKRTVCVSFWNFLIWTLAALKKKRKENKKNRSHCCFIKQRSLDILITLRWHPSQGYKVNLVLWPNPTIPCQGQMLLTIWNTLSMSSTLSHQSSDWAHKPATPGIRCFHVPPSQPHDLWHRSAAQRKRVSEQARARERTQQRAECKPQNAT